MIKRSIQEKSFALVNIYTCNARAPKYIKQILADINREIDRNTIIVGDFNTPFTSVERSPRQNQYDNRY